MWVLEQGRLPADPGGARQARERDRRDHRGGRAAAQGVRRAARGVPRSGSPRRASRPTTSSPAPARPPRRRKPRRPRRARRSARSWSPRPARHRGRDAALAGADPQGGRRPDRARDREGDPQVARRPRTRSAWSRRRSPRSTSRRWPSTEPRSATRAMEEIARVYAEALFEAAKEKGKLDEIQRAARPVRRRARREPRAAGLLLQPLLLLGGEARGDREGGLGRRAGARQLPRAARREAPDAGDLPHPAALRRALGRGEEAARR